MSEESFNRRDYEKLKSARKVILENFGSNGLVASMREALIGLTDLIEKLMDKSE